MNTCRSNGFSLIELLAVVSILGTLVSLTIPAVVRVRGTAAKVDCANRMRQLGLALHGFHEVYGRFPSAGSNPAGEPPGDGASWLARLLPYLEQDQLHGEIRSAYTLNVDPRRVPPHSHLATVVRAFVCPADDRLLRPHATSGGVPAAFTSYIGVSGGFTGERNGVLGLSPGIRLVDVTDGTSSTVMAGERPPNDKYTTGWWYTTQASVYSYMEHHLPAESALDSATPQCGGHLVPVPGGVTIKYVYAPGRTTNECDTFHFWSLHTGGANFLYADASVRPLAYSMSPVLRALATRNGGEVVDAP